MYSYGYWVIWALVIMDIRVAVIMLVMLPLPGSHLCSVSDLWAVSRRSLPPFIRAGLVKCAAMAPKKRKIDVATSDSFSVKPSANYTVYYLEDASVESWRKVLACFVQKFVFYGS